MEEIYAIEESTYDSPPSQEQFEHHHGHTHDNNIEEIQKWIKTKFIESGINITVGDCQEVYQNNRSAFDSLFGAFLILLMAYIVYSIVFSVYNAFKECRTKRILRQLANDKKIRKAE